MDKIYSRPRIRINNVRKMNRKQKLKLFIYIFCI